MTDLTRGRIQNRVRPRVTPALWRRIVKEYEVNGLTYLYPEGEQPKGAVEVGTKVVKPKNKAVVPENKAVSDGDSKPDSDGDGKPRKGSARRS